MGPLMVSACVAERCVYTNQGSLYIVTDDDYFPESVSAPLPIGRSIRSPGFRLGSDPRTPSIKEDSMSPTLESPPPFRAVVTATNVPPGGIKRTKSLMQKIKTMVRHKPESEHTLSSGSNGRLGIGGGRSMSMSTGLSGIAAAEKGQQTTPNVRRLSSISTSARSPSLTGSPVLEETESELEDAQSSHGGHGAAEGNGLGLYRGERRAGW